MNYLMQMQEPVPGDEFAATLDADPAFQQYVAEWNAMQARQAPAAQQTQGSAPEFQSLGKYATPMEFYRANPEGFKRVNPGLPIPTEPADALPPILQNALRSAAVPVWRSEYVPGMGSMPARIDYEATNRNKLAAAQLEFEYKKQQQKAAQQAALAQSRMKTPQQVEQEAFARAMGQFNAKIAAGVPLTNQRQSSGAIGPQGQKAPAGQRWTENGELEWIPGSAGQVKAAAAANKAEESLQTHMMGTDALIKNINQLIGDEEGTQREHPGLRGSVGYIDSKVMPFNKQQATAQAFIKSLLDKSAVSGLQQIRQSGTAPGSITEREWPIFQNLLATLNPAQDEESFIAQLKELRQIARESQARAQSRFSDTYGGAPRAPQAPQAPAARPSAGGYVEIRTAPNGQRIGKKADGTLEVVR